MKSFKPVVGQLAVVSHERDSSIYRIVSVDKFTVGVICATLESKGMNPRVNHIDASMLKSPTIGQLCDFNDCV